MKRLVITLGLLLVVLIGYTQVTNVAEYRVANADTEFGVNLPIGTKVYDITNNKYYVVTTGLASNSTLTAAISASSVTLLNDTGTDDQTISDLSLSGTTLQITLEGDAGGQQTVDLSGLQDGTGTDDQEISDLSLSGTNLQLTLEGDANGQQTVDLSGLQDGTGTDDQNLSFNSGTHAIDIEDGGNAVIPLATNSITGLATATHITAIESNTSNISTNTSDISTNAENISTNSSDISTLEAIAKTVTATITIGSTPSYTHSLTGLVASEGCVVAINGAVIEPNKYTLTTGNIEIKSTLTTLYEYDQVLVTYKTTL